MSVYSFKTIWATIYNELLKIKSEDLRIWDIYNYDIKTTDEWINMPAIIITPTNWTEEILDSCKNKVTIKYAVKVIDSTQENISWVEDNMRELADIVLERLKNIEMINWTTWNGSMLKLTFDYVFWFTDTQEPLRVFEITCNFEGLEDK